MNTKELFRQRLVEFYERSGMTNQEVAVLMGVSRETIFAWKAGRRSPTRIIAAMTELDRLYKVYV